MILTVRLKFGRIWIVEVKRYHSRPGRPFVTDPSFVTDERHHDPQAGSAIKNAEAGSAIE